MIKLRDCLIVPVLMVAFFAALAPTYETVSASAETVLLSSERIERRLTLIIDPGHGGADGGAVSPRGARESEINLAVAQRMEQITAFFGVAPVMTRDSETLSYPEDADTIRKKKVSDQKRRLELVVNTDNPVFISVHQNIYPSGGPHGAIALYAPTDGSAGFAEYIQNELVVALDPANSRRAAQASGVIFLMKNLSCPAVLVECGFLSNAKEESLLMTDTYRLKVAAVLSACYLSFDEQLAETYFGGANESENDLLLY